ncbi:SbcC/MukB-like Walker B domain-containing protein [Actinoplanes sp. NPDC020271]|uniref:SbcC/MukB-like Walker B domain-containing protein n=1 Tax=Actinoplanes sp. NPDC020271 TaxID=3363896 RepID=UPI00378C21CB
MTLPVVEHQPGPDVSDLLLSEWRDAACTGGLPMPNRRRWMPLRGGAVAMWEFDVVEYWFADGRVQLVGHNQSGKSTLMTLTTLIMLQGETRPHLIDTFGESGKRFRYYVEPSGQPKDRRDITSSTNRGWVWVEFGRVGDDGTLEFFTLLLFAQTKRSVQDMQTVWMTCQGTARVRDGIDLAVGLSAYEPKHVAAVDGVTVHDSGKKYAAHVAEKLFGIDDPDRYKTVLTMLRSLRTPNLGKVLDAEFFTGQIRSALPALDKAEIAELAGSWQEVEQLGRDREYAEAARAAITGYVNRQWRPWTDAVLRLHGDALLDADAAVTAAQGHVDQTQAAMDKAREDLSEETRRTQDLMTARDWEQGKHTQLLQSAAYGDAVNRAAAAQRAREDANTAARQSEAAQGELVNARARDDQAKAKKLRATNALTAVHQAVDAATRHTTDTGTQAGLGDDIGVWAASGDVDRIDAAVRNRRQHLSALRRLLRDAAGAGSKWRNADALAEQREGEYTARKTAASEAQDALTDALQELSDKLERWAAPLGDAAPDPDLRLRWMQQVTEQATTARPRQVLEGLLNADWLEPVVTPKRDEVSQLRTHASTATQRAVAAEQHAAELERAADPLPRPPAGWTRRTRPEPVSGAGAPLWRLIDPVAGLDPDILDHVEAALAAAGLLDAWVSIDGAWVADRDGDDVVLTVTGAAPTDSLAQILVPAGDAGKLTATVAAILAGIGYTAASEPLAGPTAVAADGRFRTPAVHGRAGRSGHGAELIGAAARAAARQRSIAELRAAAETDRAEARRLTAQAEQVNATITFLQTSGRNVPSDADAAAAGAGLHTANAERDRAQQLHADAAAHAEKLRRIADAADAAVVELATEHTLPTKPDEVDTFAGHLDSAADAAAGLRLALSEQTGAEKEAAAAILDAEAVARLLDDADQAARDTAAEAAAAAGRATEAEEAVNLGDKELFARQEQLAAAIEELNKSIVRSTENGNRLAGLASKAHSDWERACEHRDNATSVRDVALGSWWVPVDAGLAPARNLPDVDGRDLNAALVQAAAAAQTLRPPSWPGTAAEKTTRTNTLMTRAIGQQVTELQTLLEANGGRSVTVIEADDTRPLPAVMLTVDASGQQLSPADAIRHLDDVVADLTASHDEKLNTMYTELLSSTFIDHLADRLRAVIDLLKDVNAVLARHPTGADKMTLRLRRHKAADHTAGYKILKAIEDGVIASESAQEQIRLFLADRLQQAQDLPADDEWIDRAATLLDYRAWFDIVCEFRIGTDPDDDPKRWQALTKQQHTVDSGGGKAVTLLQPLLATLVTLYSESPNSPRPLWLDEAFVGVDLANQTTMMRMLVDFDLDFLVAGPATLVASAQVPAAAIWHIARAPAPLPGVDLSLTLWAGQTLQIVPVADISATALQPVRSGDMYTEPDLFSTATDDTTGEDGDTIGENGDDDETTGESSDE